MTATYNARITELIGGSIFIHMIHLVYYTLILPNGGHCIFSSLRSILFKINSVSVMIGTEYVKKQDSFLDPCLMSRSK